MIEKTPINNSITHNTSTIRPICRMAKLKKKQKIQTLHFRTIILLNNKTQRIRMPIEAAAI